MQALPLTELKTFIEKCLLILQITAIPSRFKKLSISCKLFRNKSSSKRKKKEMEKPKSQNLLP